MKRLITTLGALGAAVVVTAASGDVTVTPMNGDIGAFQDLGPLGGYSVSNLNWPNPAGGQLVYDNTAGPTIGFFDWLEPAAAWADDLHEISAGGGGNALITGINYAYFNNGDPLTVTHTILIYDMAPPSGTHGNSSVFGFHAVFDKGALLASIVLPGLMGHGSISVAVGALDIELPGSAIWISFQEVAPGPTAGPSFWLSGGMPVVGSSHDTMGYFLPGGTSFHYPHIFFPDDPYANIMMSLSGTHIPGPPVILAMGLGGLTVLARRRRK